MDGFEARARARGYRAVAGVDEAGRGPLAGPVVAAAVILPEGFRSGQIRDSKLLAPAARERARALVEAEAVSWAVALSTPEEIDRINILQASLLAMRRAVERLSRVPDFLYVDGPHPIPCGIVQDPLIGGDGRCLSVAAASILAKVARDGMMEEFDRIYPGYGFSRHKGYPTAAHVAAIRKLGPCPIHRRTFRGVVADAP